MTKKILVIANDAADDRLQAAVAGPAGGSTQVLVVAPALDFAEDVVRAGLRTFVERLASRGIHAEGTIGDNDPFRATIDALNLFAADEIVIATHPEQRSNGLVERVAQHYDGPILHVVVGREQALAAA